MPDDSVRFESFLAGLGAKISSLERLGITLIGSFPEGGPLSDSGLASLNASAVGVSGADFLERAFACGVFETLAAPVVIDVEKAAAAYDALGRPKDAASLTAAANRGRLRLQGTDGIRGAVAAASDGNPVLHFGRAAEITPELIRLLCLSFGRLCRGAGIARRGSKVVFAEDGRDAATGGILAVAAREGLRAAGLCVLDLAVAPTPAVPFAQVHTGARLGASLTASHNPSSQNGIKFFIDAGKMLPEGPAGDFALSAVAYAASHESRPRDEKGSLEDGRRLLDDFADFIVANLPAGAPEALRGLDLLFDPANGAFCAIGKSVFSKLGLTVAAINDRPSGHNINQGGGVAEIEGRREITAAEASGNPALASISALLKRACSSGKPAYALVLDGDGDRGFVVAADDGRAAMVVDGDAEAFVLARHLRASGVIGDADAASFHFVGTVESDLELFRAVRDELGLSTSISCVGDKWLSSPSTSVNRLAVGEEVSGHVLWPAKAALCAGGQATVLAGNGLLTALSVLAAAGRLGLTPAQLASPFPPGVFITRQTYNVNKGLFFPGSSAWHADLACIREALAAADKAGFASWRIVEMPDEPEMLYASLDDAGGATIGAVFVRNSGTENKTSVYARGSRAPEPLLSGLCLLLWRLHRRMLKDKASVEYSMESAVLNALAQGPLPEEAVAETVLRASGGAASPAALKAVLYGMRKEGLVDFREGKLAPLP